MKKIIALVCALSLMLSLCACSSGENAGSQKTPLRFFVINGPTGIGAVNLMDKAEKGKTENQYTFSVVSEPNEIVSKLSTGEADIAAVATNLAAKIYNKTNGGVTVLAVNTLGVLDILTLNTPITSFADLRGKKVYSTGQGANPEFIIRFLCEKNGFSAKDLNLNFVADGTELLTVFAKDPNAVIIAPQPVATSITMKYEKSKIALKLTDEWSRVAEDSRLMMGCVVVRKDFLQKHPEEIKTFLKEYQASVVDTINYADDAAVLCEKYGIVAKAAVAKTALPESYICFVSGKDMKEGLSGYLKVLFECDKTSVGGKLPGDDFYYDFEE